MRNIWAWGVPSATTINGFNDAALFSSSSPSGLPFGKRVKKCASLITYFVYTQELTCLYHAALGKEKECLVQPMDDRFLVRKQLDTYNKVNTMDDVAQHLIGNLLPNDEEELLAGVINDFDHVRMQNQAEELEEYDVFHNSGGLELDVDPLETATFSTAKASVMNGTGSGSSQYSLQTGVGTVTGEHPFGEHPSRTLFVRNINSNVEDSELRSLFEVYS